MTGVAIHGERSKRILMIDKSTAPTFPAFPMFSPPYVKLLSQTTARMDCTIVILFWIILTFRRNTYPGSLNGFELEHLCTFTIGICYIYLSHASSIVKSLCHRIHQCRRIVIILEMFDGQASNNVWLNLQNYTTNRRTKKLDHRCAEDCQGHIPPPHLTQQEKGPRSAPTPLKGLAHPSRASTPDLDDRAAADVESSINVEAASA